jgi:hypothetical protein
VISIALTPDGHLRSFAELNWQLARLRDHACVLSGAEVSDYPHGRRDFST